MTLEQWLTRLGEADAKLPEAKEEHRMEFWNMTLDCVDEYITESMSSEKDGAYIMLKKLFDWLPIEVVRFFYLEASRGKVD